MPVKLDIFMGSYRNNCGAEICHLLPQLMWTAKDDVYFKGNAIRNLNELKVIDKPQLLSER